MKNNLYIFGCSFAWSPDDSRVWPRQLAKHFNLELVNTGFPGQGILQHFKNWKDLEKDMKPGDMSIVVLSSPDRTYFFPDAPYFSQFAHAEAPNILDNTDDITANKIKKSKSAYIDYFTYLHNEDHFLWFLECWLRWLDVKSKELGTKTIIIPAFDELFPALQGNFDNLLIFKKALMEVCQEEYANKKFKKVFNGAMDLRANHLCFDNHNVLISKIIDGVNSGILEDTENGWSKHIICDSNISDKDWIDEQLCFKKFDEKFFYKENMFNKIVDHLVRGDYEN
jgi:hypothetical protein